MPWPNDKIYLFQKIYLTMYYTSSANFFERYLECFFMTIQFWSWQKGLNQRKLNISRMEYDISMKQFCFELHLKDYTLREKCPNTEFFLVCIFPHLDWIQRDTKYLSVFSPNAGKCGPEKTSYLDNFHAVTFSEVFSGQPLLILLHQKVQAFEIVPNLFTKRAAWKTSSTSESYSGPCQTYLIKFFWKQLMALAIYF